MNRVIAFFMGAMITVLVLGFVKINFYHHLELPKEVLNRDTILTSYDLHLYYPWITKRLDIYLVDEITTYKQTQDVIESLNDNTADKVIFHLAGYGGGVEQVFRLINTIKASKANIVMRVEAPVYSGHAYLALSGTSIEMLPYSYLMLHNSSAWGKESECLKEEGNDRGITKAQSCENFLENHLTVVNTLLLNLADLTPAEKVALIQGQEVYVSSEEVNRRIHK